MVFSPIAPEGVQPSFPPPLQGGGEGGGRSYPGVHTPGSMPVPFQGGGGDASALGLKPVGCSVCGISGQRVARAGH